MSFGDHARHPHPRVSHDLVEVAGRVPVTEVRGPPAQEPIDVLTRSTSTEQQQPAPVGQLPDPVADMLHGLVRGPASEEHNALAPATTLTAHQPVMKAQEIDPSTAHLSAARSGSWPPSVPDRARPAVRVSRARAASACSRDRHITTDVVGVTNQHPVLTDVPRPVEPVQVDVRQHGEIDPALRVPVTDRRTCPSSITPARSIARRSLSTAWSQTRSSTACINSSMRDRLETRRRCPSRPPIVVPRQDSSIDHLQGIMRRALRVETRSCTPTCPPRRPARARSSQRPARSDRGPRNRQRPALSRSPGLGINTRRAAAADSRPSRSPQPARPRRRSMPYSSTPARVTLSMPGHRCCGAP